MACTHIWSSFRQCSVFCGQTGKESPLLVYPKTMAFCFLGSSRHFPRLPPSSCGVLALFRLCSHSQPQSSPWDLTSEARASAPSLHPPQQVSRQASPAGECWSALILCGEISPLCSLHPCCCVLLRGSKASSPPTSCLHQWRGFLVCGNFSSFTAPSQRCRSLPYSFASVFSFFFCPTQVRGEFLAFWEVWGLLPAFSRCSLGGVPHVDVFFMYLWGGRWSHVLLLCHLEGPPPVHFWFTEFPKINMYFFYNRN